MNWKLWDVAFSGKNDQGKSGLYLLASYTNSQEAYQDAAVRGLKQSGIMVIPWESAEARGRRDFYGPGPEND